jgi:tetratricopeptide (TPR) repeat protein
VHLVKSQYRQAIASFEKTRRDYVHAYLAAAYALQGESERAAAELAEARRLSPDDRYSSIARLKAAQHVGPAIRPLLETTYYAGLRKAGMPE